jgi:hypothetical protein
MKRWQACVKKIDNLNKLCAVQTQELESMLTEQRDLEDTKVELQRLEELCRATKEAACVAFSQTVGEYQAGLDDFAYANPKSALPGSTTLLQGLSAKYIEKTELFQKSQRQLCQSSNCIAH